jgi:hypothetical protein
MSKRSPRLEAGGFLFRTDRGSSASDNIGPDVLAGFRELGCDVPYCAAEPPDGNGRHRGGTLASQSFAVARRGAVGIDNFGPLRRCNAAAAAGLNSLTGLAITAMVGERQVRDS